MSSVVPAAPQLSPIEEAGTVRESAPSGAALASRDLPAFIGVQSIED
ncbi:hypothetical protein QN239_31095 [Mycolicibacterium sp. Y3]